MEQLIITGATRLVLLIGDPISSVRSPQLFNRLFSEQRRDAVCAPLHVPAEELAVVFAGLKSNPKSPRGSGDDATQTSGSEPAR